MFVLFGWRSLTLQSFKPSEIGLSADLDAQMSFQHRQKYFHVFWIPCFPIGQVWVMRKANDSHHYAVPEETQKLLWVRAPDMGTPWYTFGVPLIAVVMGASLFVGMQFRIQRESDDYKRIMNDMNNRRAGIDIPKTVARLTNSIKTPEPGTYFIMRRTTKPDVYFKVLSNNGSTLTCLVSAPEPALIGSSRVLNAFMDDGITTHKKMVIAKDEMLKTINTDGDRSFAGHEIVTGLGKLKISEAEQHPNPQFRNLETIIEKGKFSATMLNIGAAGTVSGFESGKGSFKFTSKFPERIEEGDTFTVTGTYTGTDPTLSGTLTIEAELDPGKKVTYRLSVYAGNILLELIRE
jgi:hypothetical protein